MVCGGGIKNDAPLPLVKGGHGGAGGLATPHGLQFFASVLLLHASRTFPTI